MATSPSTILPVFFTNVSSVTRVVMTTPEEPNMRCGDSRCGADQMCVLAMCLCVHTHLPPQPDGTCTERPDWDQTELEKHDGVLHPHMLVGILGSTNVLQNLSTNYTESRNTPRPLINSSVPLQDGNSSASRSGNMHVIGIPLGISILLALVLILGALLGKFLCRRHKRKQIRRQGSTYSGRDLLSRMESQEGNILYGPVSPTERTDQSQDALQGLLVLTSSRLRIVSRVGDGAFGTVYKGWLAPEEAEDGDLGKDQEDTLVAVKTLRDSSTGKARLEFLAECHIMASLHHHNIVTFYGVIFVDDPEGAPQLVTEFALHGDLATALRKNDPTMRAAGEDFVHIRKEDLLSVCQQVAAGMEYLSRAHFIHRDLAARNCLLMEGLHVKISDFGMSRDIYTAESYKMEGSRLLPVRWMSPECLRYGQFTVSSDVWSFGVLLWEVYTYGRQPYCGLSNVEVMQKVCQGKLLERPDDCPDLIHKVMLGAWHVKPHSRVTFPQICRMLKGLSVGFGQTVEFYYDEDIIEDDGSTVTWDESPSVGYEGVTAV